MEKQHIKYHTTGFLKQVEYHADMLQFLAPYQDKFGHAESLTIYLSELSYAQLSLPQKKAIQFAENGKAVIINYYTHRSYDAQGKPGGVASPDSVYHDLTFLLNKAVKEYETKSPGTTH